MKVLLYGREADGLRVLIDKHPSLELVSDNADVIICYGGDGTLLSAELAWPGIPKVPIRNSRRGNRLMARSPESVINRLVANALVPVDYMKLESAVHFHDHDEPVCYVSAMNEINVHMGHVNLAVRFRLWLNDCAYMDGLEIIGDGFVVSTPFGSTAYYNQITRGVFHVGMGVAFKYTSEHTNHMVLPEDTVIRIEILRGPAVLAFDNSPDYSDLHKGDMLVIRRHPRSARLLVWEGGNAPCDNF